MSEELKPCPFCGAAEIGVFHHPDRGGVIGESWHVECKAEHCGNGTCHHEIRAEAIAAWNTRADSDRIAALEAEVARLKEAHWFYLGDDCSSESCRFGIDECISEDFEYSNPARGDHVLQISGARQVPDMWVALHYYTNEEKDARDDDESYTYTVHATEEAARAEWQALTEARMPTPQKELAL